jgi:serine/threonine protein kinase
MPAPATVAVLLERLRKSALVPPDRLEGFLAALSAAGAPALDPDELLDRLVAGGMITRFHADKLAAGKYKGFHLGSYVILDQIGTGGMGQVFLAEHTNMRRLVALKVLPPPLYEEDPVARERFHREARAAGTLDHPNIVRVYDLCQEGKILYLVMEYVEGISLQALVARRGPLDVTAACHYARQVAFGLQHAHELGFIHRDIKPANLLLERSGLVKVLDLGLVRSEAEAASGLTKQLDNKHILGTADYVAPEQAVDSSRVDARADIYALGATLYFLLAGRPLFPEGRTAQKLVWQQIKEPTPITALRPEVPAGLAQVIHRMLQKKPADRYATAVEVFEALAPFDRDDVPPPPAGLIPEPPPRVALSRGSAPGVPQARGGGGGTSQILVAAMRGGSGNSGGSSAALKIESRAGASKPDLGLGSGADAPTATRAGDTAAHAPPRAAAAGPGAGFTVLLLVLSVALVLALVGIVILLARG